jgi:Rrf2 family nitric oxide-sensitive transcriptional repressor
MFSQTVEYALRAMSQLAAEAPDASTTQSISKAVDVPGAYLAKVLQSLKRAGLITSRRGVGGGVQLARSPKKISLFEVVNAIEPWGRSIAPSKGAAGKSLSALNRRVDTLSSEMQKGLAATSIAEVAPRKNKSR